MRVTGVPKGGKRVQLFEGLTVQLPGGAVYYTDDEDQFCISMPTVPARAGMTELADGTETRWSISQLTEYAAINFDTDGTVELSDYHNVARDGMEAAAKGMAEKMSELFGFAHYEARFGAADENRIVAYTCANSNFLGDRYLPGYFLIGIPHYPEKVTLYMGYYERQGSVGGSRICRLLFRRQLCRAVVLRQTSRAVQTGSGPEAGERTAKLL